MQVRSRSTRPFRALRVALVLVVFVVLVVWWKLVFGVVSAPRQQPEPPAQPAPPDAPAAAAAAADAQDEPLRGEDEYADGKEDPSEEVAAIDPQAPGDPASLVWYRDQACKEELGTGAAEFRRDAKAMMLTGMGHAEFFSHELFLYSLHSLDGCVILYSYPRPTRVALFKHTALLQLSQVRVRDLEDQRRALGVAADVIKKRPAKYRFVYSAESAEYFGYQMWANKYGFLHSGQGDATWTRLLTCQSPDDLSHDPRFPTFTAQRHAYAGRYSPTNKPDVLQKWFASVDAPQEDVIVVLDPDSWLVKSFEPFVDRVRKGHAVGQQTYYTGSRTAQRLWKELCEANCEREMDLVGVPYIVHRDDLARIAGLWKYYTLKVKERMEHNGQAAHDQAAVEFENKYRSLDVNWASEMFGYNMAAAHLGVEHEIVSELQVRDVDGERTLERCRDKLSIHMGRAWFPRNHPAAKKWIHTEGKSFSMYGDQVWCKCNFTASTIMPWPLPAPDKPLGGLDFQSYHTLRIMHDSIEEFGPVPANEEWRHKRLDDLKHAYHWNHP